MPAVAGWFHCSVKAISRAEGRSAVAAAAYRLGARLEDHEYAELRDYSRRRGVLTSYTLAPDHAPDWAFDPESLWNAAERAENRRNSTLAREYELALPVSVDREAREAIARDFAQELVDRYGVAVTVAIHEPSRRGDDRNYHAHILATTREMDEGGLGKKTRVLDDRKTGPQEVSYLRGFACDRINQALEAAGVEERVDHRSFEARSIDRDPTTHLGPEATEMERRGEASDRGGVNRETERRNAELDRLVAEFAALEAEIAAEEERLLDERWGSAEEELSQADRGSDAKRQARDTSFEESARPAIESVRRTGEPLAGARWFEELRGAARRVGQFLSRLRDGVRSMAQDTKEAWQTYLEERGQKPPRDPPDHSR